MCFVTEYYERHFIAKTHSSPNHSMTVATSVSPTTISKNKVILLAVLATVVAVAVTIILSVEIVCVWRRRAAGRAHSNDNMSTFRLLHFFASHAMEKSPTNINRCENAGSQRHHSRHHHYCYY